jgi:hypothetical protein
VKTSRFYLTIFFPWGVAWECSDTAVRTRNTRTGRTVMPERRTPPPADACTWLAPARVLGRENLSGGTEKSESVTANRSDQPKMVRPDDRSVIPAAGAVNPGRALEASGQEAAA